MKRTSDTPAHERRQSGLDELGISVPPPGETATSIHVRCAKLREELLRAETAQDRVPVTGGTYWELSAKYRFDLLAQEIDVVAAQLRTALGLSQSYSHDLAETSQPPYFPSFSDQFFWYNIDFAVRLLSSGWDRLALLLDLGFSLGLREKTNLPNVLRRFAEDSAVEGASSFRRLKKFRDGQFQELEAKRGRGDRHEATHVVSPSTRHLLELMERFTQQGQERTAQQWLERLVVHYRSFLAGLEDALQLIEYHGVGAGDGAPASAPAAGPSGWAARMKALPWVLMLAVLAALLTALLLLLLLLLL